MPGHFLESLGVTEAVRLGMTSSSPFSGSPTFDETPFHLEADRRPALGTYVFIERSADDAAHYGRIISGHEENPRADPATLQQNSAYRVGTRSPRPGERAPHVTRVMVVELLGEVRPGTGGEPDVFEPSLLPETGKGVYEVPAERLPWLLKLPESPDRGLVLGTVTAGGTSVPFILPMEALARHVAVLGKTGVGKSWAVGVAVEELERQGVPVVAFDVLGDLIAAAEDLRGRTLEAGVDFKVPYSIIGLQEFLAFMSLTQAQEELVSMAYDNIHGDALATLGGGGAELPPLQQMLDAITAMGTATGQRADVVARATSRVATAVNRGRVLTERADATLEEIGRRPLTNVFVGKLPQRQRNLVVGAAARVLQMLRRRGKIPPFIFVLDEAHLFLPAGGELTPSTAVIRELVRTARHDGIGIILISQSPASLDKQVLLTCNTRLVFALDRDDLRIVGGTMGDVPEAVLTRIPKLAKGNALISSGADIMRHSSLVSISRERRTREGAPTPNLAEEVRRWREDNPR